jgi:hypothetical protein
MKNALELQQLHFGEIARRQGRDPTAKQAELSYRCFCCRDTGMVDKWVIQRYQVAQGVYGEYDELVTGEAGYLCQRPGCRGNEASTDTEQGIRIYARYSYGLHELDPTYCKRLHDAEIQRFRAQEVSAETRPPRYVFAEVVEAIAKSMPKADAANGASIPEIDFDEF